jgi:hypothetical protein
MHGGGWVFGSIDTYDGFARQIAHHAGMRCLSVEYALAPEHPFPAPLNDCLGAVRWAISHGSELGIDPQRIAIIGDSAGANLALATCLALRAAGSGSRPGFTRKAPRCMGQHRPVAVVGTSTRHGRIGKMGGADDSAGGCQASAEGLAAGALLSGFARSCACGSSTLRQRRAARHGEALNNEFRFLTS